MVEKKSVNSRKKSVKEFQNEIRAEENKMQDYAKKQETAVRHLCGEVRTLKNSWNGYDKDLKEAATQMRNQGITKMKEKVKGFNNEISNQKKENKAAISRMKGDVNLFVSEINGKRKDFENYTKGPFAGYIKAFWG